MNQPSAPSYDEHPIPAYRYTTECYYNPEPPRHIIYVQQPYTPPPQNSCLPILQMLLCFCCLEECLFFNF